MCECENKKKKTASCPCINKAKNRGAKVGVGVGAEVECYLHTINSLKHKDATNVIGTFHHCEKYILMSF